MPIPTSYARIAIACTCLAAASVAAQGAPTAADEEAVRAFVSRQVADEHAGSITRLEVEVLRGDARAPARTPPGAPCVRSEPHAPAGMRWWGRAVVALRCVESVGGTGAGGTVMVPVQVRLWGVALVAAAPLAAGTVLAAEDLREQEVELTREAPGLARTGAPLQGRTLVRALAAGQPVRAEMTRATLIVEGGEPVRLRIRGSGFVVNAGGVALHGAADGQPVRVRTEFGRILQGVARADRSVDVAL